MHYVSYKLYMYACHICLAHDCEEANVLSILQHSSSSHWQSSQSAMSLKSRMTPTVSIIVSVSMNVSIILCHV